MTRPVDVPRPDVPFVNTEGRLTFEGQQMLLRLVEALREVQTTVADHEARIEALEP